MKTNIGLSILLITSALTITPAQATDTTEEVCYTPVRGAALTTCLPEFDADGNPLQPCPEMLGQYRIVLKNASADPVNRYLRLAGPVHGVTNPDQTLNHVLADKHAEGLIYTFGDTVIEIIPMSECLLQVTEVLNITFGTGKYTGANGTLKITGELDQCTGVNELDLVRNEGEVCFKASSLLKDR